MVLKNILQSDIKNVEQLGHSFRKDGLVERWHNFTFNDGVFRLIVGIFSVSIGYCLVLGIIASLPLYTITEEGSNTPFVVMAFSGLIGVAWGGIILLISLRQRTQNGG